MPTKPARPARMIDILGAFCVAATLLLTSGVEIVRAEAPEETLMSVDPALVAEAEVAPEAAPAPAPAAEAPRIVHLNTRGFNYGPPPGEVDPSALRFEATVPPAAAAEPETR